VSHEYADIAAPHATTPSSNPKARDPCNKATVDAQRLSLAQALMAAAFATMPGKQPACAATPNTDNAGIDAAPRAQAVTVAA